MEDSEEISRKDDIHELDELHRSEGHGVTTMAIDIAAWEEGLDNDMREKLAAELAAELASELQEMLAENAGSEADQRRRGGRKIPSSQSDQADANEVGRSKIEEWKEESWQMARDEKWKIGDDDGRRRTTYEEAEAEAEKEDQKEKERMREGGEDKAEKADQRRQRRRTADAEAEAEGWKAEKVDGDGRQMQRQTVDEKPKGDDDNSDDDRGEDDWTRADAGGRRCEER
ncbi:hypothetical protein ACLOJK_008556 [Asimina triloba]